MAVNVTTIPAERKVIIRIDGRFDFDVHREFRDAYRREGGPETEYVVDLGGTQYMDSSALGMLLLLRDHAERNGARVRVINCGPEIRKILTIANVDRLLEIASE